MTEADILYEVGDFWIKRNKRGDYQVFQHGCTHSTLVATFGKGLTSAAARAQANVDRRAAL